MERGGYGERRLHYISGLGKARTARAILRRTAAPTLRRAPQAPEQPPARLPRRPVHASGPRHERSGVHHTEGGGGRANRVGEAALTVPPALPRAMQSRSTLR